MKTLEAKLEDSTLHLTLTVNRLDALTAREFKEECSKVWSPKITAVVADLAKLEFIDSSGVGSLLSLYKRLPALHSAHPSVKLLHPQPTVQAVIELLRLHRIFELEV